jgi:hypothetical protein
MNSIAFILTRSPFTEPHASTLTRLARAARDAGATVKVFCTLDGVYAKLDGLGVPVVYDEDSLRERGLPGPGGRIESVLPADRVVTL